MGGCGCGDFAFDVTRKVGKSHMAIQVYPGCGNCNSPVEVVLHLMTLKEARNWGAEATEEFKPGEDGYADFHMPVIDPDDLIEAAKSVDFADLVGEINLADYDNLADVLADVGRPLLEIAIEMTLKKWRDGQTPSGQIQQRLND